jgi:hypothetical protein
LIQGIFFFKKRYVLVVHYVLFANLDILGEYLFAVPGHSLSAVHEHHIVSFHPKSASGGDSEIVETS